MRADHLVVIGDSGRVTLVRMLRGLFGRSGGGLVRGTLLGEPADRHQAVLDLLVGGQSRLAVVGDRLIVNGPSLAGIGEARSGIEQRKRAPGPDRPEAARGLKPG